MELAMVVVAIALGGEHGSAVRVVRHGAFEQEDVAFLAGLEDAELGVDRPVLGDHPVGPGLGSVGALLDRRPGGPALVVVELRLDLKAEPGEVVAVVIVVVRVLVRRGSCVLTCMVVVAPRAVSRSHQRSAVQGPRRQRDEELPQDRGRHAAPPSARGRVSPSRTDVAARVTDRLPAGQLNKFVRTPSLALSAGSLDSAVASTEPHMTCAPGRRAGSSSEVRGRRSGFGG